MRALGEEGSFWSGKLGRFSPARRGPQPSGESAWLLSERCRGPSVQSLLIPVRQPTLTSLRLVLVGRIQVTRRPPGIPAGLPRHAPRVRTGAPRQSPWISTALPGRRGPYRPAHLSGQRPLRPAGPQELSVPRTHLIRCAPGGLPEVAGRGSAASPAGRGRIPSRAEGRCFTARGCVGFVGRGLVSVWQARPPRGHPSL